MWQNLFLKLLDLILKEVEGLVKAFVYLLSNLNLITCSFRATRRLHVIVEAVSSGSEGCCHVNPVQADGVIEVFSNYHCPD